MSCFNYYEYEEEDITRLQIKLSEYEELHRVKCPRRGKVLIDDIKNVITPLHGKNYREWTREEIDSLCSSMKGIMVFDYRNSKDLELKRKWDAFYTQFSDLARKSVKVRRAIDPVWSY